MLPRIDLEVKKHWVEAFRDEDVRTVPYARPHASLANTPADNMPVRPVSEEDDNKTALEYWCARDGVAVDNSKVLPGQKALFVRHSTGMPFGTEISGYWGGFIGMEEVEFNDRLIQLTFAPGSCPSPLVLNGSTDCPATYINDGMHGSAPKEYNCEYVEDVSRALDDPRRITIVALRHIEDGEVCDILHVAFCLYSFFLLLLFHRKHIISYVHYRNCGSSTVPMIITSKVILSLPRWRIRSAINGRAKNARSDEQYKRRLNQRVGPMTM